MYGLALGRVGAEQPNSIQNAALGILRRYGTNAHVYLPGANGVAISGLSSGNYTLSDGSTGYSAVDGTAGLVLDAALLYSVVAADYAARWPDLTAPTLAECQSFVAGCALEC